MRSGHVSRAALMAAATLVFEPPSSVAQQTPPPEPAAIAWPSALPALNLDAPASSPQVVVPTSPAATWPPAAPSVEIAVAKPPFSLTADLTTRLKADKSDAVKADRDAAAKVYEQRNGAPIWVSESGFTPNATALMTEMRNADAYGLQASAFRLPQQKWADNAKPTTADLADADVTLTLAALKYARHARGGRLDPTQLSPVLDRKPVVYAPESVLSELSQAARPAEYIRTFHPRHPQFERLRLKYVAVRAGQAVLPPPPEPQPEAAPVAGKKGQPTRKPSPPPQPTSAQLERKLLANMEMWRWMPELGDAYVQNNIPEFLTRLYRGGKLIHVERIVVGKPDTPTAVFSDEFETVAFKPYWNVPESIKWKELQPQLERGGGGALEKAGLRAAYNGKDVDARAVDWRQTDLRAFHVFQPPGPGNALGVVKFLFPNKHDIYMHDTPHKSLFNNATRAYSHGCMRVRDPLKFAEMLLGHDKNMSPAQIKQLADSGPENNEIRLTKKLPIHVTYFTAHVDDDGTLKLFNDIYGHEQKVHLGLDGKAHLIQQPSIVADKAPPKKSGQIVTNSSFGGSSSKSGVSPVEDWIKKVFSF